MAADVNAVVLVGRLTKDPELRALPSGTDVCQLRVACTSRRKDPASEEWVDSPNYFDVSVFGNQGAACAEHLTKGQQLAVTGRLDWREWEASDGSGKRQAVQIIAESVQFLAKPRGSAQEAEPQPASA